MSSKLFIFELNAILGYFLHITLITDAENAQSIDYYYAYSINTYKYTHT